MRLYIGYRSDVRKIYTERAESARLRVSNTRLVLQYEATKIDSKTLIRNSISKFCPAKPRSSVTYNDSSLTRLRRAKDHASIAPKLTQNFGAGPNELIGADDSEKSRSEEF